MFDDQRWASRGSVDQHCSYAGDVSPVSAHAILAALRHRSPGLGLKKAHKLLYYCQGHHLATFGEPLFAERISAWDMGPVVGQVWYAESNGQPPAELPDLDEAALNTVGYVLSRYGALSGSDLERLTHHEAPWAEADTGRAAGVSVVIPTAAIEEFFRSASSVDDDEAPVLGTEAVAALVEGAAERRARPSAPDDLDALRSRIARLRENGRRAG